MNRNRALAATAVRIIAGAAVAAVVVVGVGAATTVPWPGIKNAPAQLKVAQAPGDTVLVCNGDFRALGRDSAQAAQLTSAASPRLLISGSMGDPVVEELLTPDFEAVGPVQKLVGIVEGREAPLLAAAETISIADTDLAGLAASACREPRMDTWLIGGSVATGTKDLIVLTNPGAVNATVTLNVFGGTRASSSVVVPAGTQVALPLASIASSAQLPIVRVTAVGTPVRAVLQSSLIRTLDPSGIDIQDGQAGPQQNVVIAGVRVFESLGDDADMTVLRLLAPDADANATIRVAPVGAGFATAETFEVPLSAATPAEVSLSDLPAGEYNVEIHSDVPVVAAVRQRDGVGAGTDFTWMTAAPPLAGPVLLAIPAGPAAQLHLVNVGDRDEVVTLDNADVGSTEHIVPAGSSVAVPVSAGSIYGLSPSGSVHAAVTVAAPGALAGWPIWPGTLAQQSVTIYQ